MAIEGTACPQARTTTTQRLARRQRERLQLPMAGRDPNSPGTVIFAPTFPLALSKSRISRNGFGPLPRRDGPNAVELSDALLVSVQWAWWRGVQFQHCCAEHPLTCSPLSKIAGTVLVVSSPPTIICARNVMSFMALFPNGRKQRNLRSVLHLKPSVMQGLRVVPLRCPRSLSRDLRFSLRTRSSKPRNIDDGVELTLISSLQDGGETTFASAVSFE